MQQNMDMTERMIRFGAGAYLLGTALGRPRILQKPLNTLGMFEMGTALVGYCPMYDVMGINRLTHSIEK